MVTIRAVPVGAPDAVALVRSYFAEIIDRYHGRPMPPSLVDDTLAEEPLDRVTVLLIAYRESVPVGCAGLMITGPSTSADPVISGPSTGAGPVISGPSTGAGPVISGPSTGAEPATGEVTKVYVRPEARRSGIARQLLAAIEQVARDRGVTRLRLDTRADLEEARALYAAAGYREIPAWEHRRYADHFFTKDLPLG